MAIKSIKLSSILLLTAVSSLFALKARGETHQSKSLNDTFKEAYFEHTGNNFQNSSFVGVLNTIVGFKGFPENQISADGKLIDRVYEDALKQQSRAVSPIYTRDLTNPYSTSLQENPSYIGY